MLPAQPEVAEELRRILAELYPDRPDRRPSVDVRLRAEVSGSGRVHQAGRDQQITER
ncbi:hypothetical protein [Streptomyces sp. P17]|uniref:hypothetical protein n=1 Tax=Streptomyces sp. P17 TaxID=3074716 RepID=UPI0028F3EA60|nr:hypothetical protein [Streptomyces sp. P17]MDT9699682.1 hypothetical protein [Streptomyces sp. P17]